MQHLSGALTGPIASLIPQCGPISGESGLQADVSLSANHRKLPVAAYYSGGSSFSFLRWGREENGFTSGVGLK